MEGETRKVLDFFKLNKETIIRQFILKNEAVKVFNLL